MAYYDFADSFFQTCKKENINKIIETYQGKFGGISYGAVFDHFLKEPSKIESLLAEIKEKVKSEEFVRSYLIDKRDSLKKELNALVQKFIASNYQDYLYAIEFYDKKQCIEFEIKEWIERYNGIAKGIPMLNERNADYSLCILDDLFHFYERKVSLYQQLPGSNFEVFYKTHSPTILENCEANYGLLSVGDDFTVKARGIPKFYDRVNDTHVLINFLPNDFVAYLMELKQNNDFDLAFRPNYNICGDHLEDYSLALESVDFGKIYDNSLNKILDQTRLVDDCTQDAFLVYRDGNNVIFEEILYDFHEDGDCIVTQGVHIQFEEQKIKHIDHEYFFYSIEEYDGKLQNIRQHGEVKNRYKTFKIDNANLNFANNSNENILYRTLQVFFENQKLVKEYFEKILA